MVLAQTDLAFKTGACHWVNIGLQYINGPAALLRLRHRRVQQCRRKTVANDSTRRHCKFQQLDAIFDADRGPVIGASAALLAKELADQEVSEPAFVFVGRPGTLQHQSAIDLG
jgi:hypothetical protein